MLNTKLHYITLGCQCYIYFNEVNYITLSCQCIISMKYLTFCRRNSCITYEKVQYMSRTPKSGLIVQFPEFPQVEKSQSSFYEDIQAWFAMENRYGEGLDHHTCMQQVLISSRKHVCHYCNCHVFFPSFS